MDAFTPVQRRAFEMAFSGRFATYSEVRTQLVSEGFGCSAIDNTFGSFLERKALERALRGNMPVNQQFSWISK